MNEWYTRQEVAELLGVSKTTVYNYAKQKKILKVEDPHRIIREARYQREEVDKLVENRKRNQPSGLRPSELASNLNVPTWRVYNVIKEHNLSIDEFPVGDERTAYSIPKETAEWIRREFKDNAPVRGVRSEFYDYDLDVSLYQQYYTPQGQELRVMRNSKQEWGFYSQSQIWISYNQGINTYQFKRAYEIHRPLMPVKGYTDFNLPKEKPESFEFLDFVYQVWGIENIRLRDQEKHLALSVKSGTLAPALIAPVSLTDQMLNAFVVAGEINREGGTWHAISGYRRTTFDLPNNILETIENSSKKRNITMSEFVEEAIREKIERE